MRITRRAFLAGGASLAGAAALGRTMTVGPTGREAFLRRLLEQSVGPFHMTSEAFSAFVASFDATLGDEVGDRSGVKWRLVRFVDRLVPVETLALVSGRVEEKLGPLRRALVTHLFVTTDLASRLRTQAIPSVRFLGETGCGNPFARFDFDGGLELSAAVSQ